MESTPLTVAIINYNGRAVLQHTLDALRQVEAPPLEVMLIDDRSTDDSLAWVQTHYPEVKICQLPQHAGRPSLARNFAMREACTPYLLLLDHDVAVEPDCPARLIELIRSQPNILAVAPRLVYADDPATLYHDGSQLHYLGISGHNARGVPVASRGPGPPSPTLAGGNALLNRHLALKLGGFDEDYLFGWGEDGELFLRGRIAGYEVLHQPLAVARHTDRPHGTRRAEAQLYNRYRVLLTIYSGRSLLRLGPALLMFELCLLGMSLTKRLLPLHLRALGRVCLNLPHLFRKRRQIQRQRTQDDTAILQTPRLGVPPALSESHRMGLALEGLQRLFAGYWRLAYGHRSASLARHPHALETAPIRQRRT